MAEAGGERVEPGSPLATRLAAALAGDERPVAAAAAALLEDAAAAGATDVHLAPDADGCSMRYRLDGVLLTMGRLGGEDARRVVARLKVLASLPTYVTDLPQEGRIPAGQAPGGEWRLATFPTVHGERAVLRAFGMLRSGRTLDALGLPDHVAGALARYAAHPRGALLLCGPAGSGKTTTIYAVLAALQAGGRDVHTLEDPVEHALPGATQTQIAAAQGLTFATALRSLLRQDPEVLMVGEIRDRETADIAMEAALTGHPLLTTVHGEDTVGALVRLREMGVEPATLTSAIAGIVSQRLLRKQCAGCDGAGCDGCRGSGYRDRVPCAEWLPITPSVRRVLLAGGDEAALREAATADGVVTMRAQAAQLAADGATTAAEVSRVLGSTP
jgi:type II secretory ATPase GspE/PulE/Tfp pilus assembly ATPase PilB-like protein